MTESTTTHASSGEGLSTLSRPERRLLESRVRRHLMPLLEPLEKERGILEDPDFTELLINTARDLCGGHEQMAVQIITKEFAGAAADRAILLREIQKLAEQPLTLAWLLSPRFQVNGGGEPREYVYVKELGAGICDAFLVADDLPTMDTEDEEPSQEDAQQQAPPDEAPELPCLARIDRTNHLYLGTVPHVLQPPLSARIVQVVSCRTSIGMDGVGELELTDSVHDGATFTALTSGRVAAEVDEKLQEGGTTVHVRVEDDIATAIHKAEEKREEWLEDLPEDGPLVRDLVLHPDVREAADRWISTLASGDEGVIAFMPGPTGTGKTTLARRIGRDALLRSRQMGQAAKGAKFISLSSGSIGSSYVREMSRKINQAFQRAKWYADQGFIVILLLDECDSLLASPGEGGMEHEHYRDVRLTLQQLLSQPLGARTAVLLNMNGGRNWLPEAIVRRCEVLEFLRATKGQIREVSRRIFAGEPDVLNQIGMDAKQAAAALVDGLFSEQRVVAVLHMESGQTIDLRARDMALCCPGKIEQVIHMFCTEVRRGKVASIDVLLDQIGREFSAAAVNINRHNVREQTFLDLDANDRVRAVRREGK